MGAAKETAGIERENEVKIHYFRPQSSDFRAPEVVCCRKVSTSPFNWLPTSDLLCQLNNLIKACSVVVCICRHQKHDSANYDKFAPNFDIAYKTIQRVSVPNLNLLRPMKTELIRAKEV